MANPPLPHPELLARIDRLERKLDLVLTLLQSGASHVAAHGGPGGSNPMAPSQEVLGYIRAGQIIQAIKAYREYTNVGLKEAKDACERFRDEMARGAYGQQGGGQSGYSPNAPRDYNDDYR